MSQRITQWLPHNGTVESQYGPVSNLEWLRRERARYAGSGKVTHIRTKAAAKSRSYPLSALFSGETDLK